MKKDILKDLKYLTDFEGYPIRSAIQECLPLPSYPQFLIRNVQTVETSDWDGWKSYVVKTKNGVYGIVLESFVFTSAQAQDPGVGVPQTELNKRVERDYRAIEKAFPEYDVILSYDEDKNPTITILLLENKIKLIYKEQLIDIAHKAAQHVRYDLSQIIHDHQYACECEYAV